MIEQFLIGSHRNFTYLVTFDGQSVVIDPQRDLTPWETRLKELGSKLTGVLITHTHWDRIEGVEPVLQSHGPLPVYVHEQEARRMKGYDDAVRRLFRFVSEGDVVPVGSRKLEILHTPGHSGGECCFYLRTDGSHLFTGDTVFVGEVGRTDLETGSTRELFHTLQRLKKLPSGTMIYPGHHYGRTPTTTLGRECAESAAFRCQTVEELDAIP